MYTDRRHSDRQDCVVNITYIFDDGSSFRVTNDVKGARAININDHGMAIQTDRILNVFSDIKFMIEGIQEVLHAKVVWCKKEPVYIGDEKRMFTCGISYEEVIAERVNEILKQINDGGFNPPTPGRKNGPG